VDEELLRLAAERDEARLARDFDLADRKRDELRRRGYEVRDTPEGPELVPLRDSG
jgi:cysteinyl-tRNA synthetase